MGIGKALVKRALHVTYNRIMFWLDPTTGLTWMRLSSMRLTEVYVGMWFVCSAATNSGRCQWRVYDSVHKYNSNLECVLISWPYSLFRRVVEP